MGSVVMVVRTSGSLVVHVMMGCKLNSLVNVKNVLSPSQATDDPAEEAGGHAEAEGSATAAAEEADGAAAARDDVAALMVAADIQPPQGRYPRDFKRISSGRSIARMYCMWNGATYKALCKVHKQCSLMVQVAWFADSDAAVGACCRWIMSAGTLNEEDHWAAAQAILRAHRPKKALKA